MNANKEQAEAMLAAGLRDRLTLRLLREASQHTAQTLLGRGKKIVVILMPR
jgi:hypothetical protein